MEVRATCRWVADHASHVGINSTSIEKVAEEINGDLPDVKWDFEGIHFFDNGPLTAQYLLVLDALNFCFWPDKNLHYEHLARSLKTALEVDPTAFDASRLQTYTGPLLRELLQWPTTLPLEDERARLMREVGFVYEPFLILGSGNGILSAGFTFEDSTKQGNSPCCQVGFVLEKHFGGLASNLIAASEGSAVTLVELVACHFPGFRDHAIYKSHQVFIYKRAQIFVADVWGAFQGQGLGEFRDINCITMFADYVVPAVLRHWGILEYSSSLAAAVDCQKEIAAGSEEEVEIRACTITAVEQLRETLCNRLGKEVTSVQVDWWLWSSGIESMQASSFHHTLTLYY